MLGLFSEATDSPPTPTRGGSASESARELPPDTAELLHLQIFASSSESTDGRLSAPEWVQVLPMGEEGHPYALKGERVVRARDGRELAIDDLHAIVKRTKPSLPLAFDWDHRSLLGMWSDDGTRAAGWIDKLEVVEEPDGQRPRPGLWAHVEAWTPKGRDDVELRYYRGLSPAVRFERRDPRKEGEPPPPPLVLGLINVALTNMPALEMHLLHSQQRPAAVPQKENAMKEHLIALARKLGLPEGATEAEILSAAAAEVQASSEAKAQAATLSQQLEAERAAAFKSRVERALKDAVDAKKLTAFDVSHHSATITDEASLQRFQSYVAAKPVLGIFEESPTPKKDDAKGAFGDVATEADPKIFSGMGVTREQLEKLSEMRAEDSREISPTLGLREVTR